MQMDTPLLGDKGRWLTAGLVAIQLAPLLSILGAAIVICYAKDPCDPATLVGKHRKQPKKIYDIVSDPTMVYKIQVAAIMTEKVFVPIHDAAGLHNHTAVGGSHLLAVVKQVTSTLDSMVITRSRNKKRETVPSPAYFQQVLDSVVQDDDAAAAATAMVAQCSAHIVSHVRAVQAAIKERFGRLERFQYRAAQICEDKWVMLEDEAVYIKVPTSAALKAARELPLEWELLDAEDKAFLGREMHDLFENEMYRDCLDEFAEGQLNDVTCEPERLAKWPELVGFLVHFLEFRLVCSAYIEGRFSVASNAARTKPASTTATLSRLVRSHSNNTRDEYPTVIRFCDIDPDWQDKDGCPELPDKLKTRTVNTRRDFERDFDRLTAPAKELDRILKDEWKADFLGHYRKRKAEEIAEQAANEEARASRPRRSRRNQAVSVEEASEDEEEQQEEQGEANLSDEEDDAPLSRLVQRAAEDGQLCYLGEDSEVVVSLLAAKKPERKGDVWVKGKRELEVDCFGQEIPDDDPLGRRRADYVWKCPEDGVTVVLRKPLRKAPTNSTAATQHGGELKDYQFFSHIKVEDDFGEVYTFDLTHAEHRHTAALLFYALSNAGDKILIYGDLLGVYVTPDGVPYVEHGYLFDREDIATDLDCEAFLKKTEEGPAGPIGERELVNSPAVYHTHAGCIEGKIGLWQGSATDLPGEDPENEYFWRRAINLKTNTEVPSAMAQKALRIPPAKQ